MKSFILLMFSFSYANSFPWLEKTINTTSGKIQGTISYYITQPVQTFLGIPYAEPPVGNLRFKKTVPVKPWPGILKASRLPPDCMQFTTYPYTWYDALADKSEDCLYLNIWVPSNTTQDDSKAVTFYIHGGGYVLGSSGLEVYDGRALASIGDVIVVTINYRLGPFGFLTSGTDEAPGNVGLYDMLEALKWVNVNIKSFGGDPDRITLHGQSVGSVSINAFCISPLTKGLFSKAIMQSMSLLFFTAGLIEPNIDLGQRLAKAVGCANDTNTLSQNPTSVTSCLRGVNANSLAYALYALQPTKSLAFSPVFGDELLPKHPAQALRDGDFYNIPVLIGNTQDEASFLITAAYPDTFGFFGYKDPDINKTHGTAILRQIFYQYPNLDDLVKYYLGHLEENDYDEIRHQVATAASDIILTCVTVYFAEQYAAFKNDVFYYVFEHRPSTSPWAPWMGVVHFEEMQFVFGLPLRQLWRYTAEEVQLSVKMIEIISNFAKYGYPNDDFIWPHYSRQNPSYVRLNTDFEGNFTLGLSPHTENCNFLRGFYGF